MNDEQKQILKQMMPYLVHIVWPVLIILLIAKVYAPSSF